MSTRDERSQREFVRAHAGFPEYLEEDRRRSADLGLRGLYAEERRRERRTSMPSLGKVVPPLLGGSYVDVSDVPSHFRDTPRRGRNINMYVLLFLAGLLLANELLDIFLQKPKGASGVYDAFKEVSRYVSMLLGLIIFLMAAYAVRKSRGNVSTRTSNILLVVSLILLIGSIVNEVMRHFKNYEPYESLIAAITVVLSMILSMAAISVIEVRLRRV